VVLNAIVGAAGLRATMATLAAGADLALANKESLVAGGDLVMDALRRSGRSMLPVDSEHSALAQCLAGAAAGSVSGLVITASGGPFRGRTAEALGDADEQGPRGDRGAPPVRDGLRRHRGRRPPAVDRPRHGALPRRRPARPRRLSRHARADLVGAHLSRAGGDAGAVARPGRAAAARFRATRPGHLPLPGA